MPTCQTPSSAVKLAHLGEKGWVDGGLAAINQADDALGGEFGGGDGEGGDGGGGEPEVREEAGGDGASAVVDAGAEGGPAVEVNDEGFVVLDDAVAAEDLDVEAAGELEAVVAEAAQEGTGEGLVADEEDEGVGGAAVDAVELGLDAAADILLDDDFGVGAGAGEVSGVGGAAGAGAGRGRGSGAGEVGGEAVELGEEVVGVEGALDAEALDVVVVGELEPDREAEVSGAFAGLGEGEDFGGGEGDAEGLHLEVEGLAEHQAGALGGVDDGDAGVFLAECVEEAQVFVVAAHIKEGDVGGVGAGALLGTEVEGAARFFEKFDGVAVRAEVVADARDDGLVGVVGAARVVEEVGGFAVDADKPMGWGGAAPRKRRR